MSEAGWKFHGYGFPKSASSPPSRAQLNSWSPMLKSRICKRQHQMKCQNQLYFGPNDQILVIMGGFKFPKEVTTWAQPEFEGMVGHVFGIMNDDTKSANVMINFMNDTARVQHDMTSTMGTNILAKKVHCQPR